MMAILRIAFRNTRRQKKRSFLLGGAIAFGVMVITLVNAFTAGMVSNIKGNFAYVLGGHIYVTGKELTPSGRVVTNISDDATAQLAVDRAQAWVKQINKRSQAYAELIFGSKDTMQLIAGVDWSAEQGAADKLVLLEGSLAELSDPRAIILPQPVAKKLGVAVGETVLARLSTVTGQQNVGEFRLIAIIEDQTSFGFSSGYAHLSYLNELLGLEAGSYQMLHVFLGDMRDMDQAAEAIYTTLAEGALVEPRTKLDMRVQVDGHDIDDDEQVEEEREALASLFGGDQKAEVEPWKGTKFAVMTLNDIMAPVVSMVGVLNTIALVVFLILLVITMVGIMNTFRMIMIERTQEIGTMRAFGMQRGMVRSIFLAEALLIGLGGAIAGLLAAGVVILILSAIRFGSASVLQFFLSNGRFTFQLMPTQVITNLVLLMALTLFAAYLPARAAARLRPADALRAEF